MKDHPGKVRLERILKTSKRTTKGKRYIGKVATGWNEFEDYILPIRIPTKEISNPYDIQFLLQATPESIQQIAEYVSELEKLIENNPQPE